MTNSKLQRLLDTDELDWDDPRHRELYLREYVNKNERAFDDADDQEAEAPPRSKWHGSDNGDIASENPRE